MFKSLRATLAALGIGLFLAAPVVALPTLAYAAEGDTIGDCLSQGINLDTTLSDGCESAGTAGGAEKIQSIVTTIVNIFSIVVGIAAVIMIIYGGFKYITSAGDSGNVTSAKNTIIYAIIGLVVVALAQFIVQFVLEKVITG